MPTVTQSRAVTLPPAHEHSFLASPREPDSPLRQAVRANRSLVQQDSDKQAIQRLTRLVEQFRRRILGGAQQAVLGWHKPNSGKYELPAAPYPEYEEGAVIHIQATHDIVTSGIRDAANPTGPLVTSCAGYWVAIQDVPGAATVAGNAVWNLPQFPYPTPTNMDDPSNFWIYLGEMDCPTA